MSKCCFIIPYFGKFNNYFPLFLKSCKYNADFNWLIITDNETDYDYPKNVRVLRWSFDKLKKHIQSKFNIQCNLHQPYKLCDYKPMYGYIFEEYISEFKCWGYCDVDTIMGNLSKFLTEYLLDNYDKLFQLGHMTIFKNSIENNRLFMSELDGQPYYEEVLISDRILVFDEIGKSDKNIDQIFINAGRKVYHGDFSFNVNIRNSYFLRTYYVGLNKPGNGIGFTDEKYKKAVYVWNKGELYRLYLNKGKLIREEYAYIHLQRRKMKVEIDIEKEECIKIMANSFRGLEVQTVTADNFKKIRKRIPCNQYMEIVVKPSIKKRITKLINCYELFKKAFQ